MQRGKIFAPEPSSMKAALGLWRYRDFSIAVVCFSVYLTVLLNPVSLSTRPSRLGLGLGRVFTQWKKKSVNWILLEHKKS